VLLPWLGVIAVLFSVVGAFYYLRIVKLMYFDEPTETTVIGGSMLMRTVLSANALLALGLGIIPGTLLEICQRALQ
jgi:NADH-quinone oxidoreductase subunit N